MAALRFWMTESKEHLSRGGHSRVRIPLHVDGTVRNASSHPHFTSGFQLTYLGEASSPNTGKLPGGNRAIFPPRPNKGPGRH